MQKRTSSSNAKGSKRLRVTTTMPLETVHFGKPGSTYVKKTYVELTERQLSAGVTAILAHFEDNKPVNVNYPAGLMRHSINMFIHLGADFEPTLYIVDSSPQYFRQGYGAEIANRIMAELGCDVLRVATANVGGPDDELDHLIEGTPELALRKRLLGECDAAGNLEHLGFCAAFSHDHYSIHERMYPQRPADKNPV